MIKLGTVSELNEYQYDENWLIVRQPDEIPSFTRHEPMLSPSLELFRKYRDAYHAGEFNQEYFDLVYVPQFLKDLAENEQAIDILDELVCKSYEKDIFLACYCENELMCHRSIIAGVLLGMDAEIETNYLYRTYFYQFQIYNEFNSCLNHGWRKQLTLEQAYKKAKKFCKNNWKEHTQMHLMELGENVGKWVFIFQPFIPDSKGDITISDTKGFIPTYYGRNIYPIVVEKMSGECWECYYDRRSAEHIWNYFSKYDKYDPISVFRNRNSKGNNYQISGLEGNMPSELCPEEDSSFQLVTQESMEYWQLFFLAIQTLKYYSSKMPEEETTLYYLPDSFMLCEYIEHLYEEILDTGLSSMLFTLTLENGNKHHYLHFFAKGSLLNICDEEYDLVSGYNNENWTYTIDRTGTSAGTLPVNYDDIKKRIDSGATLDILSQDEYALSVDWKAEM